MHMQCSQPRNKLLWGKQRLHITASHTRYYLPVMPECCVPIGMPPFCLADTGNKFLTNTKGHGAGSNAYESLCNPGAGPTASSHITPHTQSVMPKYCAPTDSA